MFRQIAPNGIGNKEIVGTANMKERESKDERSEEAVVEDLKREEGNAIASAERSAETREAHEEMSVIQPAECPFLNAE